MPKTRRNTSSAKRSSCRGRGGTATPSRAGGHHRGMLRPNDASDVRRREFHHGPMVGIPVLNTSGLLHRTAERASVPSLDAPRVELAATASVRSGASPSMRSGPLDSRTDVPHGNDVSRPMRSLGTNSCGPTARQRRLLGDSWGVHEEEANRAGDPPPGIALRRRVHSNSQSHGSPIARNSSVHTASTPRPGCLLQLSAISSAGKVAST
jgi:hypothetical protein